MVNFFTENYRIYGWLVVKSRERDIQDYREWASSSLMFQRVECVG